MRSSLKELSYIHASGYAAGELKHGPIAVLDSRVPVICICVPGPVYDKTLSNAQEAKARNAQMIAVAVDGDTQVPKTFETVLSIPKIDEFFSPLLTVIPLQLMSYFIADYLGKDVDQPESGPSPSPSSRPARTNKNPGVAPGILAVSGYKVGPPPSEREFGGWSSTIFGVIRSISSVRLRPLMVFLKSAPKIGASAR